jgi:hypothetical protein
MPQNQYASLSWLTTLQSNTQLNAEHLIIALKADYDVTIDRTATKYIGLTIKWDLKNWKVTHPCKGI